MRKLFLLAILLFPCQVFAKEMSCVQYERKDGSWGEWYKVPYTPISGSDLIEATGDYSTYKSHEHYAVVDWPNGGYSAMKVASYKLPLTSYSKTITKDQSGRTYRLKGDLLTVSVETKHFKCMLCS